MKVLMFGWEFPPHISGGLGTACYGLSKGLVSNDVEVTFVVPKIFGDETKDKVHLIEAKVENSRQQAQSEKWLQKMKFFAVSSSIAPYTSPEAFSSNVEKAGHAYSSGGNLLPNIQFSGHYGGNLFEEVYKYALVAGQLAKKIKSDVIHAHDWLTFPAGVVAQKLTGKPLIAHIHATEYDRSGENVNRQVFEAEKNGMEAADHIIAVSRRMREIILERYGIPADKVSVLHNALTDGEPGISGEKKIREKVVTFLGRVTFQKGPDYFIEAAHRVLQHDDNVRFVLAGSGDMLYRMIHRAAQLRIASKVHFTGFLQGDDVTRMLAMSDVYVMPSVSEPFGISALEAASARVPVIISKQSGVSEVMHNVFKIDFWDIDAMSDAIYSLLHRPSLANMASRESRKETEGLTWEKQGRQLKQLYEKIIFN